MSIEALPQLRPLTLGELLDRAVKLYRRNFWRFVAIIAVVQIPISLLNYLSSSLMTRDMPDPGLTLYTTTDPFGTSYWSGVGLSMLISLAQYFLLQGVASAALAHAVANHYLGKSTSFSEAYRQVGTRWKSLFGALVIAFCILLVTGIGTVVICCAGWVVGPGVTLFFTIAILPLIAPIAMLERQSAVDIIRRAWDLARRRFWWILGFMLILSIFVWLIVIGPTFLLGMLLGAVQESLLRSVDMATFSLIQTAFQAVISTITGVFVYPLQLTAIVLMYLDLRVRSEGFDLTLLAESTLAEQRDIETIITQAPPAEQGNLVTWREIGYFCLIFVGIAAAYALLYALVIALALSMPAMFT